MKSIIKVTNKRTQRIDYIKSVTKSKEGFNTVSQSVDAKRYYNDESIQRDLQLLKTYGEMDYYTFEVVSV